MFSILNYHLAGKGYYINLPRSTDRREHVERLIRAYSIEGLERFEALEDELLQYSCTKSHLAVFKEALEQNLDTIFVAEDDFNIEDPLYSSTPGDTPSFAQILNNVHQDLQQVEWDVVLFGCNPKTHLIPVSEFLALDWRSTGAWAYLIKKRAYTRILKTLNYRRDYLAIDDVLPRLNAEGFNTLTTCYSIMSHGVGFESTLSPRGPVNYTVWIRGNYTNFLYDTYRGRNFLSEEKQKTHTIVLVGSLEEGYLDRLDRTIRSLDESSAKCRILVYYTETPGVDTDREIQQVSAYFRDSMPFLNAATYFDYGQWRITLEQVLTTVKTPHYTIYEL